MVRLGEFLRKARNARRKRQERITQHRLTRIDRVERVLSGWVLDFHGRRRNLRGHIEEAEGSAGDWVVRGSLSEDLDTGSLGFGSGSCSSDSTGEREGWLLESVVLGLTSPDLNPISTANSSLCPGGVGGLTDRRDRLCLD